MTNPSKGQDPITKWRSIMSQKTTMNYSLHCNIRPTQPTIQWVLVGLSWVSTASQGVKLATQHPGKNECSYALLPPVRLHGTDRDNCTFNCAFLCYNIAQSGRWGSVCWRNRLFSSSKQKCTQKLIKWLLTHCTVLTHLPSCCSYNGTGT